MIDLSVEKLTERIFLNGEMKRCNDQMIKVINPYDQTVLGAVPNCGAKETKEAVDCAQTALPAWRATSAHERAALLSKWADLIDEHTDQLALLMTLENGKPLPQSKGEIKYANSFVRWYSEEAKRVKGDILTPKQSSTRHLVIQQGIGVVGLITPWNFPAAMITRKCAPALAAGCTSVLKPSELTPFSAFAMMALASEAGFPAGTLNCLTGEAKDIGGVLTSDPRVKKLSFTGSTPVGKLLMSQSANTLKKLSLELGGHAPFIIFPDADIDEAVAGLMGCKFRNGGQACVSANRIYIHEDILEECQQKLVTAIGKIKLGNGLDADIDLGPLINEKALQKIEAQIADAEKLGAKCLIGGKRAEDMGKQFFQPTLLTSVTHDMLIAHQETFGPVLPVLSFKDENEVIAKANDSEFGLAAYFYTRDIGRSFLVAEQLDYGMIGINTGLLSNELAPFGGVKSSGMGREGGHWGLEEYTEIKSLNMAF